MYSIDPTHNAYLYCLPEHPMKKDASAFRYLSIKKVRKYNCFTIGETILLLYRKNKYGPSGIIGFCKVAGELTKVSELLEQEKDYCFNSSYLQLPVNELQCCISINIMDEDVLYSLPSMNNYGKFRVYTECNLINIYTSVLFALMNHSQFWFIWKTRRTELEIQQYKQLFVHLEREKIEYKRYLKLSKKVKCCQICGIEHQEFTPYALQFFEFHEMNVNLIGKYEKINYNKFIPLCANCHKIEHEQMVAQSSYDNRSFSSGFSPDRLLSGWNTEYFNKKFEL